MKFWTVQNPEVVEILKRDGFYQPDFEKSSYLFSMPPLKELYQLILRSFNFHNKTALPGLVFSFLASDDNKRYYEIFDIQEFYFLIQGRQNAIKSLWKTLNVPLAVILELDYSQHFNPILIDINDFQFIMPPLMIMPPYTMRDAETICQNIREGKIASSPLPSGLVQAHLPWITVENVTHIYPMFDLVEPK